MYKNTPQTITAEHTYNVIPVCTVAPTTGYQFINKNYGVTRRESDKQMLQESRHVREPRDTHIQQAKSLPNRYWRLHDYCQCPHFNRMDFCLA